MSKTTLFDSRIKKYAYREAAQIYGELSSSPAGLSPEQVEKQRENTAPTVSAAAAVIL